MLRPAHTSAVSTLILSEIQKYDVLLRTTYIRNNPGLFKYFTEQRKLLAESYHEIVCSNYSKLTKRDKYIVRKSIFQKLLKKVTKFLKQIR